MTIEDEIELVYDLLSHPAGFDIDIAGLLWVRQYEWPQWAVEWNTPADTSKIEVQEFNNALDAATFFVAKRYELGYGLDFDLIELEKLRGR